MQEGEEERERLQKELSDAEAELEECKGRASRLEVARVSVKGSPRQPGAPSRMASEGDPGMISGLISHESGNLQV